MSTVAQNAKAIFLEAVENHQPEQWSAFLEEKCGEDRELRYRVEGLLQAHQEKDDLFDRVPPAANLSFSIGTSEGEWPQAVEW